MHTTTREPRRSSMAAATSTNGFPTPRHRIIPLSHFSEQAQPELQHTTRLRPVISKKIKDQDRVRDSSRRNKRKRGSHTHREESEQSIQHGVENEQDHQIKDAGVFRMLSSLPASSASDQNHRRILPPPKLVRPALPLSKRTDEMIAVTVPRKARSASAKRSHDSWTSTSGAGAERNSRQWLNSRGRQSVEAASPSSSNESVWKKMKAIEPKESPPKTSKSSSANQEAIEIEIAELLYGLMYSKKQESSQKLEINEKQGISRDSKTSHSFPTLNPHCSISPRSTSPSSRPSTDVEQKIVEDNNSSPPVPNKSIAESVKFECKQPVKAETLGPESAMISSFNDESTNGREARPSGALRKGIKEDILNSGAECCVTADGRPVSLKGELPACSTLDVDAQDSSTTRASFAVPEANGGRVNMLEIDLMASPPMVVSPERDDITSETKALALDVELVERQEKQEHSLEETEEMKMDLFKEKRDILMFDLEKPNEDNISATNNKFEEQNGDQEQPQMLTNPEVGKTVQSRSVSLSTAVSGRSSNLPRNRSPLQTVVKTDKTTGSLATPQDASFVLSEPLPKRCATHHWIARNILHQQFKQTNHIRPTKPNDVNGVPSAESMVVAKQSQKNLPAVKQNASQEKERVTTSFLGLTANESSDAANSVGSTQRKQIVTRQRPHPTSASTSVHGPAFPFPPGQHQSSVTAATSQAGGLKSTSTASSTNKPNSSAAGSICSSSGSPAVTAATNFSYSNLAASDTPYVAIIQKNGYPFPFSTPLGATTAVRGTSPAQATHLLNGPFYSSQMFHLLQHPQQHPHSQVLVRPGYIKTSTSNVSSSSSSHKQSRGGQVNSNNILTSASLQLQRSQKEHASQSHPLKFGTEVSAENAPPYSQKNAYGHNLTIPVQPVNFSFRPSSISDSVVGIGGNFGDQPQKQQALGGAELVPSHAFAVSFATFNGTSAPSNLNFSSVAQNPLIIQSLPDMTWQGCQAAGTSRTAQLKTYSMSDGQVGGNSSHQDNEKKTISGKSSKKGPTTLNFDKSSKNLMLSPVNGSWPIRSIAPAATTTNAPLPTNISSSQQLLQLQKQHGMQQQQPSMANGYKASPTNTTSAAKLVNNPSIYLKNPAQSNSSDQASQSKSSGRTTDSQFHLASIITSNKPSLKSFYQDQGSVLQGHTQISFGENYKTSQPPQGQHPLDNNKSVCTKVAGSPPTGGNLKLNSLGNKLDSSIDTLQKQQTENFSAGSSQKSSPVCRRNVPSILASGPSHFSEL